MVSQYHGGILQNLSSIFVFLISQITSEKHLTVNVPCVGCWPMTLSFKSSWYCTFFPKTKTRLNSNQRGLPSLPKLCLWVRGGPKEIERQRDRWSGWSFPCPPLPFELFFHSSSSFGASFHSSSDKALHSLPYSPPASPSHTPTPSPPSWLLCLACGGLPWLLFTSQTHCHWLDPPSSGCPPLTSLPLQNTLTHICTQQPGHSPPLRPVSGSCYANGRKGWGGQTEQPAYSQRTEGGRAGRLTPLLHLHSHGRAAADLQLHKESPHPSHTPPSPPSL